MHHNWELYDALHPVIKLDNLTPKQISKLLIKAYQKVYLSRAHILNFSSNRVNGNKMPEKPVGEKIKTVIKAIQSLIIFRRQIINDNHAATLQK